MVLHRARHLADMVCTQSVDVFPTKITMVICASQKSTSTRRKFVDVYPRSFQSTNHARSWSDNGQKKTRHSNTCHFHERSWVDHVTLTVICARCFLPASPDNSHNICKCLRISNNTPIRLQYVTQGRNQQAVTFWLCQNLSEQIQTASIAKLLMLTIGIRTGNMATSLAVAVTKLFFQSSTYKILLLHFRNVNKSHEPQESRHKFFSILEN